MPEQVWDNLGISRAVLPTKSSLDVDRTTTEGDSTTGYAQFRRTVVRHFYPTSSGLSRLHEALSDGFSRLSPITNMTTTSFINKEIKTVTRGVQ